MLISNEQTASRTGKKKRETTSPRLRIDRAEHARSNGQVSQVGSSNRLAPSTPVVSSTAVIETKGPVDVQETTRSILIVDDFKDDREMYAHFLSTRGFHVILASDGEEGMTKALKFRPDLILMDLWLPGIGGWEAIRRLKADKRTKHIPIVVLTARIFVSAKAVGSDGCLIKPCRPDEMVAEITRVLGRDEAKN
jgi:two-component system, cell cycle response regulator DivK